MSGLQFNSSEQSVSENDSIESRLIALAYQNDISILQTILTSNPELDLTKMQDKRFFTLLHIACLNNLYELLDFIIGREIQINKLEQIIFKQKISSWVNKKTDEGFTAIHFASFRGNIKMIELLERNGADIYALNYQGLTVMHIAAQGDQPISLTYFMKKDLDLNSLDQKGSTPLHWACYLGCENSVNYLTSWSVQINSPDYEGNLTPLHLAVISGNSKVVRKLLIKGADRKLKDFQDKTPFDIAKEQDYNNIMNMLDVRPGITQICNFKQNFKPMKKKRSSLYAFFVMFFGCSILEYFFVIPFVNSMYWMVFWFVLFVLTLFFFISSWLKNTGVPVKKQKQDLLILLQHNDCSNICPECCIVKPVRSRHCELCHLCIQVYDHHCPWINNCIGAKNHVRFLFLLYSIWVYIIFLIILNGFHVLNSDKKFNTFIPQEWDEFSKTISFIVKLAVSGLTTIIGLTFIVPLSMLNLIQTKNFFLNKTTSERFGYNANQNQNQSQTNSIETSLTVDLSHSHAENRQLKTSYFRNCYTMCCKNSNNQQYQYIEVYNDL